MGKALASAPGSSHDSGGVTPVCRSWAGRNIADREKAVLLTSPWSSDISHEIEQYIFDKGTGLET
jgi:hypothetical protein